MGIEIYVIAHYEQRWAYGSLVPHPSHSSFYLAAVEKKRGGLGTRLGEGLVPLITYRDVCTRRVDLDDNAKGLTCPRTN